MPQKIIVVVPGTSGTLLLDQKTDDVVWPDQVTQNPDQLVNLLGGELDVGSVFQSMKGNSYYPALIEAIADATPSGESQKVLIPNNPALEGFLDDLPATSSDVVIGWGYDWRIDCGESAQALATFLGQLDEQYSSNSPEYWIVAHSMGGLLARYVNGNGLSDVAFNLITLGTPHLGAPLALAAITGELPKSVLALFAPGVTDEEIQAFVNLPDYPSTYQLLPPENVDFINGSESISAATEAVESKYNGQSSSFSAMTSFQAKLAIPGPSGLYVIYGNSDDVLDTVYGFTLNDDGTLEIAYSKLKAGDTIVPSSSASFSGWTPKNPSQVFDAGAVTHIELPINQEVQKQVVGWIYPGP